jgi:hypothetical protein
VRLKTNAKPVRLTKFIPKDEQQQQRRGGFSVLFTVYSVDEFEGPLFRKRTGEVLQKLRRALGYTKTFAEAANEETPGRQLWERIQDVHRGKEWRNVRVREAGLPIVTQELMRTVPAYRASEHSILLPPSFKGSKELWASFFHELVHSTKRTLEREFNRERADIDHSEKDFNYSTEELVAEIGAYLLMSEAYPGQSQTRKANHAVYVENWARELQNKPWRLAQAARKADEAVNFLLFADPAGPAGPSSGKEEKDDDDDDDDDDKRTETLVEYFTALKEAIDGDDNLEMDSTAIEGVIASVELVMVQEEANKALPQVTREMLQDYLTKEEWKPSTREELVGWISLITDMIPAKKNVLGCALPRCDRPAEYACAQCKTALYCSARCQRVDWNRKHSEVCAN